MITTLFVTIIVIILVFALYQKSTNAICLSRKRLEGKTVIVTGGTAGIGFEISKDLALRGARVIIACPFPDEGKEARQRITEETQNENVVFKLLDLGSLESVRKFAADIVTNEERLDILVNNAGVVLAHDILTPDGMHPVMQINYYGSFLLTLLLLPLLKKSGTPSDKSRITNTASTSHLICSLDIENYNSPYKWIFVMPYANSKISAIMFTKELAKRLEGSNVVVNTVDPGAVGTRIFQTANQLLGPLVTILFSIIFKTPWEGAQTALHVLLDTKAGQESGKYFKNCEVSSMVRNPSEKDCLKMWEDSLARVKLTEEEVKQCLRAVSAN